MGTIRKRGKKFVSQSRLRSTIATANDMRDALKRSLLAADRYIVCASRALIITGSNQLDSGAPGCPNEDVTAGWLCAPGQMLHFNRRLART